MRMNLIRRASALAAIAVLATATSAFADTVPADGDQVAVGNQMTVHLGSHAPGELVQVPVTFSLACAGTSHVDEGQTLTLDLGTTSVPLNGTVSATSTTIGPIPASWTDDGQPCPIPAPVLAANAPSTVSLTMPTTPGTNFAYTLMFTRTGPDGLTGLTIVTLQVDVVVNTRPSLVLPAPINVEGDTTGGAVVTFAATATDLEDDPDPTPSCDAASGSVFPVGTTTVTCSVSDSKGLTDSGSFDVTVADSTKPSFGAMPDVSVTTADAGGTTVSYSTPSATDTVDPDPTVECSPASGSHFDVGSTAVTCTATDDDGNTTAGSFDVNVAYDPGVRYSVVWGEPIGGSPAVLSGNQSRNVPVKVEIFANGTELTSGSASLRVETCGDGAAALTLPLSFGSGRWNASLDTARLQPGCYKGVALHAGHVAGSFTLDLRGADPAKTPATSAKDTTKGGPKK